MYKSILAIEAFSDIEVSGFCTDTIVNRFYYCHCFLITVDLLTVISLMIVYTVC